MFTQLLSLESWGAFARRMLVVLLTLVLSPVIVFALAAVAFVLVPACVVGIPFMVPALFDGAAAQHHDDVVHHRHHPAIHAHAHA